MSDRDGANAGSAGIWQPGGVTFWRSSQHDAETKGRIQSYIELVLSCTFFLCLHYNYYYYDLYINNRGMKIIHVFTFLYFLNIYLPVDSSIQISVVQQIKDQKVFDLIWLVCHLSGLEWSESVRARLWKQRVDTQAGQAPEATAVGSKWTRPKESEVSQNDRPQQGNHRRPEIRTHSEITPQHYKTDTFPFSIYTPGNWLIRVQPFLFCKGCVFDTLIT